IQGGDPLGRGTGGPGYTFDDELPPERALSQPYQLAMANAGQHPDPVTGKGGGTAGPQLLGSAPPTPGLHAHHPLFRSPADDASRAVVDSIAATPTGAMDRPVQDVTLSSITIEDCPPPIGRAPARCPADGVRRTMTEPVPPPPPSSGAVPVCPRHPDRVSYV